MATVPQNAEAFAAHLDAKLGQRLGEVERSPVYRLLADPATQRPLFLAVMKNILLEVFSYGPHVTEATFTAIGRFPKTRPDLMKPAILHDLEEADHGEMALQDYVRLGGSEEFARSRRITPASWVMAATCRMLAERENPFSYLGFMYPFEGLTPILTERAQGFMAAQGFPDRGREFIDVHAKEDISHAKLLRNLVIRVVSDFPDAMSAIDYGFDCFACTYPLPIWSAALERARQEVDSACR